MVGSLTLVLHSHLPYVRHPEYPEFLEERWLFEAITECYLPLIQSFEHLVDENIPVSFSMSFSPTLLAMLSDDLLKDRYKVYLKRLIALAEKELDRTRFDAKVHPLAQWYHKRLVELQRLYCEDYHCDLVRAFQHLARAGVIDPIACAATHGYLPLMEPQSAAVRAQVKVGVQAIEKAFGCKPHGFWLPECGYVPGHERWLAEAGIEHTFIETHGVLFAEPRPQKGVYAPVQCPNGVVVFGRDLAASKSVWSATEGYPKDENYREFYRDIGMELDYDYLRPYLGGDGSRVHTGLKYHRITGPIENKDWYDPEAAEQTVFRHAKHFVQQRMEQFQKIAKFMEGEPVIVACFDTELFGHWWFEGPLWLKAVAFETAEQEAFDLLSAKDYLEKTSAEDIQTAQPTLSSWGVQGYHEMWLNGANDWVYPYLHKMVETMQQSAETYAEPNKLQTRVLNQMARELLLAQSSDWAFILKTQTHSAYAGQRLKTHMSRFARLAEMLKRNAVDEAYLQEVEAQDPLFPWIDYKLYATKEHAAPLTDASFAAPSVALV